MNSAAPSARALLASRFAILRGGKGFRTPSRDELRGGNRSARGQRREAIRKATCGVIRAQQLMSAGVSSSGAMLLQARRQLAAAQATQQ